MRVYNLNFVGIFRGIEIWSGREKAVILQSNLRGVHKGKGHKWSAIERKEH